jgi:hypothetical protein
MRAQGGGGAQERVEDRFPVQDSEMQQVKKYQRFAALCLEQARSTTDPRLKAFLAEMAQEWQRLAEDVKGQKVKQDFRSPTEDPGD